MSADNRESPGPDSAHSGGGGGQHDPGGGGMVTNAASKSRGSWAEVLGSTLSPGLNKNILEVVLEKDQRGGFIVSDHDCARVMNKIGLDMRPGVNVESVQICPNGRGVILITLKPEIPAGKFCRHEVFEVTSSGIRAVNIKPVGKREAVVTIRGLHPNTKDEFVMNYLSKFARPITTKVVYGVFTEGPLVGFKNGDRSYKLEVSPNVNIGTYHAIDGQKVTLRYLGQQQTCARCHETARHCRGGAIARRCEATNGQKIEFSDYIWKLWQDIGYVPGDDVEMAAIYDDFGDCSEPPSTEFTPTKSLSNPDRYNGVSIRQFPKDTDTGEIMELLVQSGLPETLKENVVVRANGLVSINDLDNKTCLDLIDKIHGNKFFGRKLFCNGVIPLTPQKNDETSSVPASSSSVMPVSTCSVTPQSAVSLLDSVTQDSEAGGGVTVSSPSITPQPGFSALLNDSYQYSLSNSELVRRHSLSLRSPPKGSIADEILGSAKAKDSPSLERTRSLLAEVKDLQEQLSDFASCKESSDSSCDEDAKEREVFRNVDDSKRGFKKKRKASGTPPKEFFKKKQYLEAVNTIGNND